MNSPLAGVDSPDHAAAIHPSNSVTPQRPGWVATITAPGDLSRTLTAVGELVRSSGQALQVVPQATGHGAGAPVGDTDVLLDTSRLTDVVVDPASRTVSVGAGATWSAINAAAERHGLLGLAGSAPTVSVCGYTFGGGIGWLVRRDGLASGSLRAVHYVDGDGRLRTATDDAPAQIDRDALWAFRGAGGVGIAHTLEFDLFPAPDLHAGALLWHVEALPDLLAAWSGIVDTLSGSVSHSISVLHVPPLPLFPPALHGRVAVHLAIADPDGPGAADPLLHAMRSAATPVSDTWGPSDAARLASIHLDPPVATPAVGDARWLGASIPDVAAALLSTAAGPDSPLVLLEIRHTAGAPTRRSGALVSPPGDFIYHAVGTLDRSTHAQIQDGFAAAQDVWRPVDTGYTPGSWIDGAAGVPGALPTGTRRRAAAIADAVDPAGRIRRSRLLG